MMRLIILFIVVLSLLVILLQQVFYPESNKVSTIIQTPTFSDKKVRYKIGFIDPRFHISQEQLRNICQQATDIWFLGTHTQLFAYDPDASLSINLIYDERQAESNLRRSKIAKIESEKKSSEFDKQQLEMQTSDLSIQSRYIDYYKSDYESNLKSYNQSIEQLNRSAVEPSSVTLNQLNLRKEQLERKKAELDERIVRFNQNVVAFNNQSELFNQKQIDHQQSIQDFNHVFTAREFHKGEFNGHEINIYEFQSINDLKITLAHEFGHALGLMHSDDPNSLMYPVLEKQNLDHFNLKQADLDLLKNSSHANSIKIP